MSADFVIKTGDFIRITIFPPVIVPMLNAPIPMIGTSKDMMVIKIPVCREGDELPPTIRAPMPYTAPPFVTPGTGMVSVTLTPLNNTLTTKSGGKAVLIKGAPFIAEFQVIAPTVQPTPVPVPDPVLKKTWYG